MGCHSLLPHPFVPFVVVNAGGGDSTLADQIARENPLPATKETSYETPNEQPLPASEETNEQAMSPVTLAGKFVLILNYS